MTILYVLFAVAFAWLLAIELRFQGLKTLLAESKTLGAEIVSKLRKVKL